LKLKILYDDVFQVVGVMAGEDCPVEDFITNGEQSTAAMRMGLEIMLKQVSINGFENIPRAWSHEANKAEGIYEFIKGRLRLFYFHGKGNQIAVCTTGVVKKGSKADKQSVNKAVALKKKYFEAVESNSCEVVKNEDE
jgi:Phage derived protein Gp49-like (DUF891)